MSNLLQTYSKDDYLQLVSIALHYALKYLDLSEIDFSSDRATLDGFKTVGNSIVRYPAWNWSSIDDFSQSREKNIEYFEAKHLTIFVELFRFADRIDFNAKNLQGEIPLHKVRVIRKYYD